MKKYKKKNIEQIIHCIASMLSNNAELGTDGIGESLTHWLEDGNAFYFMEEMKEDFTKKDVAECCELMEIVEDFVDNLTQKLYEIFEESEKE